jgi:hypothetical protein
MTPAPTLQDLIGSVERDAPGADALTQLATASATASQLEQAGDALLSHYVDRARREGHSWSEISAALGVTKQAVHKRFSFPASNYGRRFTDRARNAFQAGVEAAAGLGHGYFGPEHLLLGLFAEPAGLAAKALSERGVDRAAVEERIVASVPRGPATTEEADLRQVSQVSHVLETALSEALRLGHNYIGTEHFLLALYRDPDAVPARVLVGLGADEAAIRARLLEMIAEVLAARQVTATPQ